ncbi:MAG TPA: glutamine--fructose-6-phosphate transaminase (isomerizing) [Gammaproteobacteria bacterium]|nr:glutamine--fructose-6-phosphate transaminase (isomerizing) [Gammaproteobacteria bacterium]
MCGIIAALAQRNVTPILLEGLQRLEYRGYDSSGIAVIDGDGQLGRVRVKGKVAGLAEALENTPLTSQIGIAHTRWATHGEPSEANAHPHMSNDRFSLVHNGIIENHEELRDFLKSEGYRFDSATDTEVVVHLIDHAFKQGFSFDDSIRKAVEKLRGAYAIAVLHNAEPQRLIAVRRGSPMLMGVGVQEYFLASDTSALIPVTQQFIYLHDGDLVDISDDGYRIEDEHGQAVEREIQESYLAMQSVNKGAFKHYMMKEIYEQPAAVMHTLSGRVTEEHLVIDSFDTLNRELLAQVEHIHMVACGTSYHAAAVARYWFEQYTALPCSVEIASEFRYRTVNVPENTLYITLSQSGETADTLAALEMVKELGYLASLAICNVPESSMVRAADASLLTNAGPEIGVASTKAFTTQLVALLLLVTMLARAKGVDDTVQKQIIAALNACPELISGVLKLDNQIEKLAEDFIEKEHSIFLGRGPFFPIALEGALKLKEISYIHAEGYPAGELKHGPLALIDSDVPVVAVAPNDNLLEKLKSNLEEVRTRGGRLYVLAEEGAEISDSEGIKVIKLPACPEIVAPIVFTVPLQLLSYHVAVMRGTDVDQPRNLAKSVTVE